MGELRKALFNEYGDIELSKRRMINGNTTNLNDFNNMKYTWVSDWYRHAMNNFLDTGRNQRRRILKIIEI